MNNNGNQRDRLNKFLLVFNIILYTAIPCLVLIYLYFTHQSEFLRLAMIYITLIFVGLSLRVNLDLFPINNFRAAWTFVPYAVNWVIIFFGIVEATNIIDRILLHGLITFIGLFTAFWFLGLLLGLKGLWRDRQNIKKTFFTYVLSLTFVFGIFVLVPIYAIINATQTTFGLFTRIMDQNNPYLFALLIVSIITSEIFVLKNFDQQSLLGTMRPAKK